MASRVRDRGPTPWMVMKDRAVLEQLAHLLMSHGGNVRRAAASLHIEPVFLRKLIRRYKLEDVLREARR